MTEPNLEEIRLTEDEKAMLMRLAGLGYVSDFDDEEKEMSDSLIERGYAKFYPPNTVTTSGLGEKLRMGGFLK